MSRASISQIGAIARLRVPPTSDDEFPESLLLAIRRALVGAVEAIDGYLRRRRGIAAAPARGEVYTCECVSRDAQGKILWLVVHESEHLGSVVLGQYDNRSDAEVAAGLEAGRLGARYEPARGGA